MTLFKRNDIPFGLKVVDIFYRKPQAKLSFSEEQTRYKWMRASFAN